MESRLPLVSVVLPTYGREQVLCQTLAQLLKQTYPSFEVILVDQTPAHSLQTEAYLRALASSASLRLLRLDQASLPHARNVGVRHARGDIVLFVDDDVIPDQNLISSHARAYGDPHTGGVAGRRTVPGEQESLWPIGQIDAWGTHISNFSSTLPSQVEWASGCHMSFRRELIALAGFFEPKFLGTAAYEDVDFCFRIRRLGYTIRFVPEAHLVHLRVVPAGCGNRRPGIRYHYSMIHNSLLFFLRHYPARELLRLFLERALMVLSIARQQRNPFIAFPLAGAFFQVWHSYLVARRSLPGELRTRR
jgi:GT2 family glycosyltransferase